MYDIIKRVIAAGRYQLPNVLDKINSSWAEGSITDAQRDELAALARSGADAGHEVDVMAKLQELEDRVRKVEERQSTDPAGEEYPAYVEGKWYYAGDKCAENGKNYVCVAPAGVVCVWSPNNYPAYWEEVTEDV